MATNVPAPKSSTPTVTNDNAGNIAVLDAAVATVRGGTSLQNQVISKLNRSAAWQAALVTFFSLGLGAGSEPKAKKDGTPGKPSTAAKGHGSICRQVLKMVIGNIHGSDVIRSKHIDPAVGVNVLARKDFATQGKVALKVMREQFAVSDATWAENAKTYKPSPAAQKSHDTNLANRAKNLALTENWLKTLEFRNYMKALIVIADLGNQIKCEGIELTPARAFGLALGHTITAAEFANSKELGFVTSAK
jgi:hypothetical protein